MQGEVFPVAEAAWQQYLSGRLLAKVGTRTRPDAQFVKILRAGGNHRNKILDRAQMIFECYHEDDALAAKFAATVSALVFAAEGSEIAPGVHCKKVESVSGPSNIYDEQHPSSRYSFTVMTDLRARSVPDLMALEGTKNG